MIRPVDLHCHSKASDGLFAPGDVPRIAEERGIRLLCLTDHDTTAGIPAAAEAARLRGIALFPGVEISASEEVEAHILGFFIDPQNGKLQEALEEMRRERWRRIEKTAIKLRAMGIHITEEDLQGLGKDDPPGRAHIARIMVEKGYCADVNEAFARYLSKGKEGFVQRETMSMAQAFALIREAGGVPVLAHPGLLGFDFSKVDGKLALWKEMGLAGVEAHHSAHSEGQARHYEEMARRRGLLVTGGSDFHSAKRPKGGMGSGMDAWRRWEEDVEALFRAAGKRAAAL